jgi:predicted phosphodiesterase
VAPERWAVLGDVHGNLTALTAVLQDLAQRRCDGILCTGDLVNYGPAPNECVAAVLYRAQACVLGNHDQLLAASDGGPAPRRPGQDAAIEDVALRWTGEHLRERTRAALGALPSTLFWPAGCPGCCWRTVVRCPPTSM